MHSKLIFAKNSPLSVILSSHKAPRSSGLGLTHRHCDPAVLRWEGRVFFVHFVFNFFLSPGKSHTSEGSELLGWSLIICQMEE